MGLSPPLRAVRGGPHPWEWHKPIFDLARELGILAFSSPFDPTAVEFLEGLEVPAYKIASSEIVDLPLIRLAAQTGKPLIISTGMASVGEIAAAVEAAHSTGNRQVMLLSCTVSYPADPASSNLRGIPVMREAFGVPVGPVRPHDGHRRCRRLRRVRLGARREARHDVA